MNKLEILINKYISLKESRNIPHRNAQIKELKIKILKLLNEKPMKIGNFIVVKSYINKDKDKPYFQIYTTESWKRTYRKQ